MVKIQKAGFWVLILIMVGIAAGTYGSKLYFKSFINDSVKLQRMIVDGRVYDIIISPISPTSSIQPQTTTEAPSAVQTNPTKKR